MSKSLSKSVISGEHALIESIRCRVQSPSSALRLGIGDDCAILRPESGEEIVVTTDFSLEGVHFRRDWHSPESIGHRCLARGLSDLAAMGARPLAAFLSLAVPSEFATTGKGRIWIERFLNGLLALARHWKVPLAGGDTAQSPQLACFDIVLIGAVPRGRALLRSTARSGDLIYVTGSLGGAAAELLALERVPHRFVRLTTAGGDHPHLFLQPRLSVAARLAAAGLAHSAIDISDGLSIDLTHICDESNLAAELDAASIPVHPLASEAVRTRLTPSALDLALHGGEDYELLFTASPVAKIPKRIAGVPIHRIGRMLARRARQAQIILRDHDGRTTTLAPRGWEHFRPH